MTTTTTTPDRSTAAWWIAQRDRHMGLARAQGLPECAMRHYNLAYFVRLARRANHAALRARREGRG